jgi:hypothetical protein
VLTSGQLDVRPAPATIRAVVAVVLALLLAAAPAQARLRPVSGLRSVPSGDGVGLAWRDRSVGETRYELRRTGLRKRLKRNASSYLDRTVKAGGTYRYSVRACRGHRCAKVRRVTIKVPTAAAPPPVIPPPVVTPPPPPPASTSPTIGDCAIFPPDNPWNTDISRAPVDTSHDYIGALGSMTLWPDFGGPYGILFVSVPFSQPLVPVGFDEADESDPGPYPTPLDAPVEDGDRHVLTLRQGDCKLFELYDAMRSGGGWHAYSGAVWDLHSNALRPDGWTSADAAGLPMLPGLARVDEARAGAIRHALRITVPVTQNAYIHPATHAASANTNPNQPPMGLRLRLKAGYDISRFGPQARAIAQALKTYGALVADNAGSPRVYVGGATDPGWDVEDLNALKTIPASALEAVVTGPVIHG